MIDKAVILAAGLGNRISGVSREIPKPLLPIDGQKGSVTFLDWHLKSLSAIGVKEIFIVGNLITYGTRLKAMESVKAEWILNPTEDLSTSGSGHSTWYAFHSKHEILDGKSRVILMDADIAYDPDIFRVLDQAPGSRSKTLVCSDYRHTQEEVMVFADRDRPEIPRYHGKGLLETPLTEGCVCMGEATGVLLWEPGDHATLRAVTDWQIQYSTAKTRSEHEDITQRMMLLDRMSAVGLDPAHAFMEVDTPDEYKVLVEEFYPRVIKR
jgi:choline kinase